MAKTRKKKKNIKKKKNFKEIFLCILLCFLAIILSFIIFKTELLKPRINESTANYISFNNSNATDMLKISDVKRQSDNKGKSLRNKNQISFEINGKKDTEYEIIVYSITNKIEDKYVKFYLLNNKKELISNDLEKMPESNDGGKIIYQGKINNNNNKMNLRLWIDEEYKKNTQNISYEIKIKPR